MSPRLQGCFWLTVSIGAGCIVIAIGDYLIGVRLELFYGIKTFSPLWVITMTIVPLLGGIVVSLIYGLGGKMMSYFPALIVHGLEYWDSATSTLEPGVELLPLGYWGFIVIVAIECAAVGGVLGEVWVKKTYGRVPPEILYKDTAKDIQDGNSQSSDSIENK